MARIADERWREGDSSRRLPTDLAARLIESRICHAWVAKTYGGDELDVIQVLDAIEEASYWDGSFGWCAMIAATTALLSGFLPARWAEEIYGDPAACTGGFALPHGRALAVEGGLVVSGRWQWGSGADHCTWIGGGALVVAADGAPCPRPDGLTAPFVFFRRDEVELLDTWDAMGMRATGSTDYQVTDVMVPEGRWASVGDEDPVVDGTLYRFPFMGALALGICSVSLGLARRALDELIQLAGTKRPAQSRRTLAERQVVQAQVAEAEAAFRSARSFVREQVGAAWAAAAEGPIGQRQRRDMRLAATNATLRATAAVDIAHGAAGGSSVHRGSGLERAFRDAHVASQHAMVSPRTLEAIGRVALGVTDDPGAL